MAVRAIVVMGVSGSGKSTVGALLARRLGWPFAEADDFHSAANVAKMRAGIPLTDDDRWPWLDAMGAWMRDRRAEGRSCVVTCSALKRAYRDRLRGSERDVLFVHLQGAHELIAQRMASRSHPYMPVSLLKSQFDALEPPDTAEALVLSIDRPPEALVEEIVARVRSGAPDHP